RFTLNRVLDTQYLVAQPERAAVDAEHRVTSSTDDADVGSHQARKHRLRRLWQFTSRSALEPRHDGLGVGCGATVPIQQAPRIVERRGIRYSWTGGDHAGIVADDIGDDERAHGSSGAVREPAAFDGRQVLADGVQCVNVRART